MKLVYVGPAAEVTIADLNLTVANGVAVDIPDELAEGLLTQGCEVDTGNPVDPAWKKAGQAKEKI